MPKDATSAPRFFRMKHLKRIWPYAAGAICAPVIWGWFYGNGFRVSLKAPLGDPGDLWVVFSLLKSLIQGEWWPFGGIVLHHIGAPFPPVFLSVDYPLLEQMQFLIIRIIGFFTSNPFLVMNLYYLLGFVLTVWATLYALRRLRVSSEIGLVLGLLFAFLPFHFFRYGHIMLASYWVIPMAVLVLLWVWSAKPLFTLAAKSGTAWRRLDRKTWSAVALSLFIGTWHIYYAFFYGGFLLVAGISAAWYRKNLRHMVSALILLGLVLGALLVTAVPSIHGRIKSGKNGQVAQRYSIESEYYGLKLANLFVPVPGDRIRPLAKIEGKYHSGTMIAEGIHEYVGAIAASGLLLGLLALLFLGHKQTTLAKLSVLMVSGILYATLGGFSALFATLVTPQIRCPNRVSPFLAFLGLLVVGLAVQKLKTRVPDKKLFYTGLLLLAIFGLGDQISPCMQFGTPAHMADEEMFFQKLEAQQPHGSILQLPYVPFPENPPVYEMGDYSHLRAYLFTKNLNWSYGAMKGREQAKQIEALSLAPLDVQKIRAAGYSGIYIDRYGFNQRQCPYESQLETALGIRPLESENKRFVFFKL